MWPRTICACLIGCVAIGCQSKSIGRDYMGEWDTVVNGVPTRITFRGDGTALSEADLPLPAMGSGKHMKTSILFTCEESGGRLILDLKDVTIRELPSELRGMEQAVASRIRSENADSTWAGSVLWEGKDKFTVTGSTTGEKRVFRRRR